MIAFLGWGSLVWDPGALPINHQWHADGPYVRAEFLRKSNNGRLTLVLALAADPVRSLWTTFDGSGLSQACEALRTREGIPVKNLDRSIGSWSRGDPNPECILDIEPWAASRGIESVVWTSLPPKFNEQDGVGPSADEAVEYLSGLKGPTRVLAEQYIRQAPQQVDTTYRRKFEAALGWSYAPNYRNDG
jgi:hypothetical protein